MAGAEVTAPENKPGDELLPAIELTQIRVAATEGDSGPRVVLEFLEDPTASGPGRMYRIAFDADEFGVFVRDLRQCAHAAFPVPVPRGPSH